MTITASFQEIFWALLLSLTTQMVQHGMKPRHYCTVPLELLAYDLSLSLSLLPNPPLSLFKCHCISCCYCKKLRWRHFQIHIKAGNELLLSTLGQYPNPAAHFNPSFSVGYVILSLRAPPVFLELKSMPWIIHNFPCTYWNTSSPEKRLELN